MVGDQKAKTISRQFVRLGHNVALILPQRATRNAQCAMRELGLLAGSSARVILPEDEFRVRRVSSLCLYDLESLDEYRQRRNLEDATRDCPE